MIGDTPRVIAGDKVVGCRSGVADEFEGAVVSIGVLQSISMEPCRNVAGGVKWSVRPRIFVWGVSPGVEWDAVRELGFAWKSLAFCRKRKRQIW